MEGAAPESGDKDRPARTPGDGQKGGVKWVPCSQFKCRALTLTTVAQFCYSLCGLNAEVCRPYLSISDLIHLQAPPCSQAQPHTPPTHPAFAIPGLLHTSLPKCFSQTLPHPAGLWPSGPFPEVPPDVCHFSTLTLNRRSPSA